MRVIARLVAELSLYFWTESNLTKDPLPRPLLYQDAGGDEHSALREGSCQVRSDHVPLVRVLSHPLAIRPLLILSDFMKHTIHRHE
jgi:hypothetical protein